jgi:hypothetical protein
MRESPAMSRGDSILHIALIVRLMSGAFTAADYGIALAGRKPWA